jgi:hypothetical protein
MKYFKKGQPTGGVIPEVMEEDHVVGSKGYAGLRGYRQLVNDPTEWNKYKSFPEYQAQGGAGETNTCTNQSLCEIAERFINYYFQNGLLPEATVRFLTENKYIDDGKCNLSESWLAKMSGTDPRQGNSLTKNCLTVKTYGLVPEAIHPDDYTSYQTYWREVSQASKDLGLEFNKHFQIFYSWLYSGLTVYNAQTLDEMKKHLLEGLLYSAVPVCSPWNNQVKFCGRTQSDHAVVVVNRLNHDTHISDSYDPMDKVLTNNYVINACMKVVFEPIKGVQTFQEFVNDFLTQRPLNIGLSVPEFGSYYTTVKNQRLTDEQITEYMFAREKFITNVLSDVKTVIKEKVDQSTDKSLLNKILDLLKSIIK